jgi:hypothetical protein
LKVKAIHLAVYGVDEARTPALVEQNRLGALGTPGPEANARVANISVHGADGPGMLVFAIKEFAVPDKRPPGQVRLS